MQAFVPESIPDRPADFQQAPYCELMQSLLALETRRGLFDLRVAAAPVWEYLRLRVYLELVQRLGILSIAPQRKRPTPMEALRLGWGAAQVAFSPRPAPSDRSEIVFFGYSRRVRHDDGLWYDPHVDPLLDGLPWSHLYIEQRHRRRNYRPIAARRRVSHDYFDLRVAVQRRLSRFRLDASERALLNEISRDLTETFGVRIDLAAIAEPLLDRRRCLLPLYRRFFERTGPKLLMVVSPNCAEMAALEAARSLGIRTAELQHGVIGAYDPAYSFPSKVHNLQCVADDLLLLDDFWRHELIDPPRQTQLWTVGFQYGENARPSPLLSERLDQIVFLSQPTIGIPLSKFAVELARDPRRTGRIVYRLHPDERNWREQYPWLVGTPLEVDEDAHRPLYSLLAQSRAQVGVYSFALLEGLSLGLQTYLLDVPGVEALAGLATRSIARIVQNVDDVLEGPGFMAMPQTVEMFPPHAKRRFHDYVMQAIGAPGTPSLPAGARSA